MDPRETLEAGRRLLEDVLLSKGFTYLKGPDGSSSGGDFASARFVKDNRVLELHLRHSLGLVTYHIGELSLTHEAYMRAMVGRSGKNKYPNFSDDPLDAFRALAFDLQNFCRDFLNGSGKQFARCVEVARLYDKLPGMAKLTRHAS